jgi:hypothetical protein
VPLPSAVLMIAGIFVNADELIEEQSKKLKALFRSDKKFKKFKNCSDKMRAQRFF